MKKLIAVLAIVAFMGGMSATAFAQSNDAVVAIELADKDPKKAEKKSSECTDAKKSECTDAKKSECDKTAKKACDEKK
ncbi:MAG: hypothetical protein WD052_11175 [Bacteroidales bacterium]